MPCTKPCDRKREMQLNSGDVVCSYCPDYMLECESKYLLGMPLHKRREALRARLNKRGEAAYERLTDRIREIWTSNQNARNKRK